MSNEHPNMHGNPMDEPLHCVRCGEIVREEDCFGVAGDDELIFCSASCVEEWEDSRKP